MSDASQARQSADMIDERGVDRAQIRRMLAWSPAQRLQWLQEFMESVIEIRCLNEDREVR
jgi:hypothetical protein